MQPQVISILQSESLIVTTSVIRYKASKVTELARMLFLLAVLECHTMPVRNVICRAVRSSAILLQSMQHGKNVSGSSVKNIQHQQYRVKQQVEKFLMRGWCRIKTKYYD